MKIVNVWRFVHSMLVSCVMLFFSRISFFTLSTHRCLSLPSAFALSIFARHVRILIPSLFIHSTGPSCCSRLRILSLRIYLFALILVWLFTPSSLKFTYTGKSSYLVYFNGKNSSKVFSFEVQHYGRMWKTWPAVRTTEDRWQLTCLYLFRFSLDCWRSRSRSNAPADILST